MIIKQGPDLMLHYCRLNSLDKVIYDQTQCVVLHVQHCNPNNDASSVPASLSRHFRLGYAKCEGKVSVIFRPDDVQSSVVNNMTPGNRAMPEYPCTTRKWMMTHTEAYTNIITFGEIKSRGWEGLTNTSRTLQPSRSLDDTPVALQS